MNDIKLKKLHIRPRRMDMRQEKTPTATKDVDSKKDKNGHFIKRGSHGAIIMIEIQGKIHDHKNG